MKCVVRTKDGVKKLSWLLEKIANAEVPMEVRPLLFDSKRIALEKDSQHQLSIERLVAAAAAAMAGPAGGLAPGDAGLVETAEEGEQPKPPACERCGHKHWPG